MQIPKVQIIASLAGAIALQLHGQPASPDLQNKALDLLRQTLSQQSQHPAQPAPSVPAPAPLEIPKPPPVRPEMPAGAQVSTPATSQQQQRALQILRENLAPNDTTAVAS